MAVTKIWAVTDSISRVIQYAANPEKTEFSDIKKALHYIGNQEKTVMENEKTIYVTGVNCTAETAFQEMISVQERFDKTTGNVAYHAYQSFKTGEVSPQLAHQLGVELARKMWAISIRCWSPPTLIPVPIITIGSQCSEYLERKEIQLQRGSVLETTQFI